MNGPGLRHSGPNITSRICAREAGEDSIVVPTRQEAGWGSHSRSESCGEQMGVVSFTPQLRYPRGKSSWYTSGKRLGGQPSQYARCGEEKISRYQLDKDGPG